MFKTFGYLADREDPRDFAVENMLMGVGELPDEYNALATAFGQVLLTQEAQSCVGFSLAEALYAAHRLQGVYAPLLASPLFIWWNARKQHMAQDLDLGTYIRVAVKQMAALGFCPEGEWPTLGGGDLARYAVQPSRQAFRAAYDQRLSDLEYYRVTGYGADRTVAWKTALSNGCPIVFGMPVHENYAKLGEHIAYAEHEGVQLGGHAQCALGYDSIGPYGPGTWGREWGNGGWWHLSWSYVERFAMDQWALRVPQYFSSEHVTLTE